MYIVEAFEFICNVKTIAGKLEIKLVFKTFKFKTQNSIEFEHLKIFICIEERIFPDEQFTIDFCINYLYCYSVITVEINH